MDILFLKKFGPDYSGYILKFVDGGASFEPFTYANPCRLREVSDIDTEYFVISEIIEQFELNQSPDDLLVLTDLIGENLLLSFYWTAAIIGFP